MTYPLAIADRIAAQIVQELVGYCERIEIAGSVRRRRPAVHDIDLVILPKTGQLQSIINRASRVTDVIRRGDQNFSFRLRSRHTPVQVDLFFARERSVDLFDTLPTNFGSLMVCRTGSVEHNIYLVERAKEMSLKWHPYHGVYDPSSTAAGDFRNYLASEDEGDIFRALKLDYVPPEKRER